jgi:hypothetical protein
MDDIASMGRGVCTLLWAGVLALGCGCSLMQKNESTDPRAELLAAKDATAPDGKPAAKYAVELHYHEAGQRPERVERSITGPVTIQQALSETKADQKFKRFTIDLYRHMPDGGTHKMAVEYDRDGDRVVPEFDYALQAGDRLMVIEDPTSAFEAMIKDTIGPMSLRGGEKRGRTKSGGFFRVEG